MLSSSFCCRSIFCVILDYIIVTQDSCVRIKAFVGLPCQFTIICSWENRGRSDRQCGGRWVLGPWGWKFAQFLQFLERKGRLTMWSKFSGDILATAADFSPTICVGKVPQTEIQIPNPNNQKYNLYFGDRRWLLSAEPDNLCLKSCLSIQTCPTTTHHCKHHHDHHWQLMSKYRHNHHKHRQQGKWIVALNG